MSLSELIDELYSALKAGDKKKAERVYRFLARVGMDRMTVNALLEEKRKGEIQ